MKNFKVSLTILIIFIVYISMRVSIQNLNNIKIQDLNKVYVIVIK